MEEVSEVLFQICPTEALGLNGLLTIFYQNHWRMVKIGVFTTCMHILNKQGTIASLNHIYFALILKIGKPRKITDYRPISWCNIIYRIVTKTIANRLKQFLHQVISQTQSAFTSTRLIIDNIIICYECLRKIRHSKGKRKCFGGFKNLKLVKLTIERSESF